MHANTRNIALLAIALSAVAADPIVTDFTSKQPAHQSFLGLDCQKSATHPDYLLCKSEKPLHIKCGSGSKTHKGAPNGTSATTSTHSETATPTRISKLMGLVMGGVQDNLHDAMNRTHLSALPQSDEQRDKHIKELQKKETEAQKALDDQQKVVEEANKKLAEKRKALNDIKQQASKESGSAVPPPVATTTTASSTTAESKPTPPPSAIKDSHDEKEKEEEAHDAHRVQLSWDDDACHFHLQAHLAPKHGNSSRPMKVVKHQALSDKAKQSLESALAQPMWKWQADK